MENKPVSKHAKYMAGSKVIPGGGEGECIVSTERRSAPGQMNSEELPRGSVVEPAVCSAVSESKDIVKEFGEQA